MTPDGRQGPMFGRCQHTYEYPGAMNEIHEIPIRSARTSAERQRQSYARIGWPAVRAVVDDFYERIQRHPTLAQPFAVVTDWEHHKARLTHFWWISLGGDAYAPYRYRIGEKHAPVGVTHALVDDWLSLFRRTLDDHLPADLADLWFERAQRMGDSLRMLSDFYQRNPERSRTG